MIAAPLSSATMVKVWDPLVRIFHWSLVLTFAVAYVTGEDEGSMLHIWAGYVIGGLVLFRLLWGMVGPTHARFSDFVTGPRVLLAYARDSLRGSARRTLGHSPLGGTMVVALLVTLALATLTGLMLYGVEERAGPLAGLLRNTRLPDEALEELHEFFSNLTLGLVTLHILGVLWSSWQHDENLIRAMITGRKRG